MKSLITILTLVAGLNAFALNDIEKIVGENDLVPVNADGTNVRADYQHLINAFGIISMGCTATHIGNGYVLTAGHCFDAPSSVTKDVACDGITVKWGVRHGKAAYMTSKCERIIAEELSDHADFAIFKVSPVPDTAVGVQYNRKMTTGGRVTIFSHPNMLPLHWSKFCFVQLARFSSLPEEAMQYKCDTNPGSSGATVLDVFSKKVVAIHDGGISHSKDVGMNYGTYLNTPEIAATLKELGF